jgi:hypothetical protein
MPSVSRLFIALSLLALVLTHTLALTAVRVQFEWQRAEIARTLCENRNHPEMGCNGSCVLRKELKAATENTGGLLRLGSDTLADLFLPAESGAILLPQPAGLRFGVAARTWPHAPDARADAGFGRGLWRPPAYLV